MNSNLLIQLAEIIDYVSLVIGNRINFAEDNCSQGISKARDVNANYKASPAPRTNNTPSGSFCTSDQFRNFSVRVFGITNNEIPPKIAITAVSRYESSPAQTGACEH